MTDPAIKLKLQQAIHPLLNGDYVLKDGTPVKGQEMNWLATELRSRRWSFQGYVGDRFEEVGFKLSRGRRVDTFFGGKPRFGRECTVVYA